MLFFWTAHLNHSRIQIISEVPPPPQSQPALPQSQLPQQSQPPHATTTTTISISRFPSREVIKSLAIFVLGIPMLVCRLVNLIDHNDTRIVENSRHLASKVSIVASLLKLIRENNYQRLLCLELTTRF